MAKVKRETIEFLEERKAMAKDVKKKLLRKGKNAGWLSAEAISHFISRQIRLTSECELGVYNSKWRTTRERPSSL